jgi:TPP-dependent trihydroxycyclohexane-1,2-dione (THcHDO) dehydratase
LSEYSDAILGTLSSKSIQSQAAVVLGTGTDFVTDFDVGDVFIVNNEYFITEAVANSTFMTVDRHPSVSYSGISAYRQVI